MTNAIDGTPLVLVVDNDRDTLVLYERVFSSSGFRVRAAADAADGLRCARALLPAVIVMDLSLPGAMNGGDLIRAIRADAATRDIPILIVTGYQLDAAPDLQVAEVLLKPVSPRTLVSRVRTVLAGAEEA